MNELTGFLFPRPSFIEGIARIMDFDNALNRQYLISDTPNKADELALAVDWQIIGDDLYAAYKNTISNKVTDS